MAGLRGLQRGMADAASVLEAPGMSLGSCPELRVRDGRRFNCVPPAVCPAVLATQMQRPCHRHGGCIRSAGASAGYSVTGQEISARGFL